MVHWKKPFVSWFLGLVAANVLLLTQAFAETWVYLQVSSHSSRDAAVAAAQRYVREHDDVAVHATSSGFFAVTIAHLPQPTAQSLLNRLLATSQVPSDVYLTEGARFGPTVWSSSELMSVAPSGAPDIYSPFDASLFSFDELRILQLALAFEGDYNGLLDGDWGWMSQRAMRSFSYREAGEAPATWHAAILFGAFLDQYEHSGWELIFLSDYGVSLIFPTTAYREDAPSGAFSNWSHLRSSLRISMARTNAAAMQDAHRYVLSNSARDAEPYTVRGQDRFVTRIFDGAEYVYARSERVSGMWSTIVLAVASRDEPILDAVTSGISAGRDRPLSLPENGNLERTFEAALAAIDGSPTGSPPPSNAPSTVISPDGEPSVPQPPSSAAARPPTSMSSGTGFMLNEDGYLLTNEHVVDGCRSILVSGLPAQIIGEAEQFDLAVLSAPSLSDRPTLSLAPNPAALNEEVVAAGFPLLDILGGLNVTQGSVTSMTGVRGDGIVFQHSAPIQPGSSGGPLVDEFGNVVGVVVAQLSPDAIGGPNPSAPQNVNFAIRSEIVQLFLAQNNIEFRVGGEQQVMRPVELGALVRGATHPIQCER